MRTLLGLILTIFLEACAAMQATSPAVSILVDLDPARADRSAYISNFDTPRRDNMDTNGQTALDGIGASIARITP